MRPYIALAAMVCISPLASAPREEGLAPDLFRAIRKNDVPAVRSLLRKRADVNATDSDGATALMQAVLSAGPECVELLLSKGVNPNAKSPAGATALMWAVHDIRKVRLLLARGADVNARSNSGKTALLLAAGYDAGADVIRLLLDKGADPAAKDVTGANGIILAAESGNAAALDLMIERGLDVNSRTGPGFNEVQFGIPAEAPEEMIRTRQNMNSGFTALMLAANERNLDAVKFLIAKGADVNAKTGGGLTPLLLVANKGDTEIVKTLLDKGADVNARDPDGYTPLILAAASESLNTEVVEALLTKGADVNAKGRDNRTALAWAVQRGQTPVVRILKKASGSE